ncbi:hypothetical protein JOB18_034972 [Solea senegalensis]|uniref:SEFIR domain-containing protein n=1 Tax=Solea senegalensis TaxID=28829 RepID=A0AAV6QLM3_SOLSE|nr:interleukin-17 receptor C [Solea senegalensis]KAG7494651.1 hypothetical protein JOB18_034972 [Solea senegalensis]KAG7494652.1 hypothetical protein JOB18_034972 [Solea senegalensis]
MFHPGRFVWRVLLILHVSASGLEPSGYDSDTVMCSQGLSKCTMKDEMFLLAESDGVDVQKVTADFKFCSKTSDRCFLCLVIDIELHVHDTNVEFEGSTELDEEFDSEGARNSEASVTMCYKTPSTMPTCKKVEFTVNHTAITQQNHTQISMVITQPAGVSFGNKVLVYPHKFLHLTQEVDAPSLNKVCSQKLKKCAEECRVPELRTVIPKEMNSVELQFDGRNDSFLSLCIQYEKNGMCQRWNRGTIPLSSVTRCMCLMAWYDDKHVRAQWCPFTNMDFSHKTVWRNVSVSVRPTNNYGPMLLWNLSAPCRLDGEVWPCRRESSCREMKGFRQKLAEGAWRQNSKGLWERRGVFEDIDLQPSPCVMVKIEGMRHELGPFCFNQSDRWRWSLLTVGVMLLVFLTLLVFYIKRDFVKKWAWSWHHGGFVKIGRKDHVVLLSPPDVDNVVAESVCGLGSLLCNQGLDVTVDQWSRTEQSTLGPLPWLHSQLLKLNHQESRVVVVLTHSALQRAEEWTCQYKDEVVTKKEDEGPCQVWSPYSDVFTASLRLIHAHRQQGGAGERFLLVKFASSPINDKNLPELLQGLPLFQLPSQTQALLTELRLGVKARTSRGKSRWKRCGSDGWRAKTKNSETKPLNHLPGKT